MGAEKKERSGGAVKFLVVLFTVLAIVLGAIEWARRVRTPALPTLIATDPAAQSFPRELRDAAGETLVIMSRPNRIVSQTLATDEIILAICHPERIVALSSLAEDENYSNVAEEARQVPGRATRGTEQLLQLRPDLIFIASYSSAETVQLLKMSQAPVFRFANFDSLADIKGNIRTVGHAVGNDLEADALIRAMDKALAAVHARVPPAQPPPRVMSFGLGGYTAGAKTIFDDMVRAVGATNASAENGIVGFAKISFENISEWQPDFIVTGANRGEMAIVRKNLLADPIIATSRAGRRGRIIVMDNRHFLTVSQYFIRGVEDLADGIYGKPQ